MSKEMEMIDNVIGKRDYLAVIGLGYVGLPLALYFAEKVNTIGFDINDKMIQLYKSGKDMTREVGDDRIPNSQIMFTSNQSDIVKASFVIIAVPTPVNINNDPDLSALRSASEMVGRNLKRGAIVVYESTVYPGVTEEMCVPILERESGMKCGLDFKVGYSPERINPGDKEHRIDTVVKVVSGMDQESLEAIAKMYGLVVKAGVYSATSIRVAEAAKVMENTQRDINIAFINEMSVILKKAGIEIQEVLNAARTKWNFLKLNPGFVGGHCIGVDPYYIIHKARELEYNPELLLSARRINNNMSYYVYENVVNIMKKNGIQVEYANVLVLGITYKENVPDIRNSKVFDIIKLLKENGANVLVCDPIAEEDKVKREYGIDLVDISTVNNVDAVIIAVAHQCYRNISIKKIKDLLAPGHRIVIDVKGILKKQDVVAEGFDYWCL